MSRPLPIPDPEVAGALEDLDYDAVGREVLGWDPDDGEAPTLRFVRASEIRTDIPPVTWAADGLILRREITLIVGDGEVYKTTLLVVIAVSVAAGICLFEHAEWATTQGDVLIITGEDAAPLIRNRIEAICAGCGIDPAEVLERIHVLDAVGTDFSIDSLEGMELVIGAIRDIRPVAVLFDPHAELTGTKENENDAAKGPVKFYRACATATEDGCAVITAHHAGKMVEGKRKIDRIRGASRLYHAARAVFFLERTQLGVGVEAIKFNRGPHPAPFVLEPEIESDPDNLGRWASARFSYLTQYAATESAADQFVRDQLRTRGRLKTTDLKDIAKTVPGVSGADVSGAIKRLSVAGEIDFEPGPRGAKLWGLTSKAEVAGQPGQPGPQRLPGRVGQPGQPTARGCLPPLGGNPGMDGCGQDEDYEDEWLEKHS